MEYLFLRRKKTVATSERQKTLLFKAADRQWKKEFVGKKAEVRKVDCNIYKGILYQLEIRQMFLDASLSLKKLSDMLETNQTYLSNAVNKYFGCNLKELVNTYRVEYAKELLCSGRCDLNELPRSCGFASRSAFYSAFSRFVGVSPLSYQSQERRKQHLQTIN
ncbi:helix-turn-helix domain-containing protein [Phocaeicola sp.]